MSSDWSEVRLEDVTSILGDGLHGTPSYDENGDYYFINGNNLGDGKIIFDEKTKRTSKDEYLKYKKNLNDRTILVSINGTIGNVGLYNGEKVILGKSACYFNVLENVDKQFIRYVVTSRNFQNYINSLATGSTIKNVSLKLMREFAFKLPPLNEQKEISKVLEDLDSKIELNRRMSETLEAIARAIFKSWFVDFDPVRAKASGEAPESICRRLGLTPELLTLFPDCLVDSELGVIPAGWLLTTVDEGFELTMGQSPPGDTYNEAGDGLPFYQGRTDFGFRFPRRRVYCTAPTKFADAGDTLISVRAPVGDVNMAEEKCCIGRGVAAACHKSGNRSYTYYFMRSLEAVFGQFEAEGTVFGAISKKDFHNILRPKPPRVLVDAYDSLVGASDDQIANLSKEVNTLSELRDVLLPKFISGDLQVSVKGGA